MSEKLLAVSNIPPLLTAEGEYDAICAAVMHSARGRWFLEEYARRVQNSDTQLMLDSVRRLEAMIRESQTESARLGFRAELLDMARTIAQTRAEVAGLNPAEAASGKPATGLDSAERMHGLAALMRDHGLDPKVSEQIGALASSVLAASSLRDPSDQRAQKLNEVLRYLERRIDTMLTASAAPAATEASPEIESVPGGESGGDGVNLASQPNPAPGEMQAFRQEFAEPDIATIAPATDASATDASVESAPSPAGPNDGDRRLSSVDGREGAVDIQVQADLHSFASFLKAPADADPQMRMASVSDAPNGGAVPVPSMWEAARRGVAESPVDSDPADFLLEPLPSSGDSALAESGPREPASGLAEIEGDLFAEAATTTSSEPSTPPALPIAVPPIPAADSEAVPMPVTAISRPLPNDPLAALNAMSDEERIALFT